MRISRPRICCAVLLCAFVAAGAPAQGQRSTANTVYVAVSSNFAAPLAELSKAFKSDTGNSVKASPGSTGKLYAQIKNGGPFEVFVSADAIHVERLVDDGLADRTACFTYAIGRLALYAPHLAPVDVGTLNGGSIRHLAIANPETAPYGAAAVEVLGGIGLADSFADRIVKGENIAQTFQFVESGGAEAGFVAYAQVKKRDAKTYWLVPERLHAPIRQDTCLLRAGESNPAAKAFLVFLRSERAVAIIESYGYGVDTLGALCP